MLGTCVRLVFAITTIIVLSACGSSSQAPASSANANLENLFLSHGTLNQAFSRNVTSYTALVPYEVSSITVTPSLEDTNASVQVNASSVSTGQASELIPLDIGDNLISVVVTAADGNTRKIYRFTITRQKSDNARLSELTLSSGAIADFTPTKTSYNITVEQYISSVSVTATPENQGATLTINNVAVASGQASSAMSLTEGETLPVSIEVTAQDGVSQQTYTLFITRKLLADSNTSNLNLTSLTLSSGSLSPQFSSAHLDYQVTVTNAVDSLQITATLNDLASTLEVAGAVTASGSTTSPISLMTGLNTLEIVVTSFDGNTSKTYTLNVFREPSANATLSALTLSASSLDQTFASNTLNYTATVEYGVNSIDITPTLTDATASIKINNQSATNGQAKTVSLSVGSNTITIQVTAEDSTSITEYQLVITRKTGDNANLSGLSLSAGTLTPVFNPNTTVYVAEVANNVSSLSLTPTLQASGATMTVNSTPLNSGDTFGPQALSVGSGNTFTIEITSENGGIVKLYTLTVTRYRNEPIFTSGTSFTIEENTTAVTIVNADHDAGATVTYSFGGGVDDGLFTINANTGALAFATISDADIHNDNNGDGTYEITVRASATVNSVVYQTDQAITVTLTAVDEAPVFSSVGTVSVDENLTAVTTVIASDPEGNAVTYSLAGGTDQAMFGIDTNSGVLTFNSAKNYENPEDSNTNNDYVVVVQASDGIKTATQTITVNIANVNETPAFTSPASVNVDENLTAVTTVNVSDPEGDAITYSITGGEDQSLFTIDANSGALSFNSAPDYETPNDFDANRDYLLEITADDGGASVMLSLTVSVIDVNEAPTISSSNSVTINENLTAVTTVTATDPENDTLTYSVTGGADGTRFSINPTSGALSFNSAPDYDVPGDSNNDNNYEVDVQASDGTNATVQTITVVINGVDEAPVFSSSNTINADENLTAAGTISAYDPEGATITYSITGGADASKFTINANSGALSFNSAPDYETPTDSPIPDNIYEVEVTADEGGLTTMQALNVVVNNVNEPPTITSANSASIDENTTTVLTVTSTDVDGDTPVYSISGGLDAAYFSIDSGTGVLSFTNPPDFDFPLDNGGDNFYNVDVSVSDGANNVSQSIVVEVLDIYDLNVNATDIKTLTFSWNVYAGASYYKLWENPDGASGYTQLGTDITGTSMNVELPVHLTDWANAQYILEAFDSGNSSLASTAAIGIDLEMINAIGYLKAYNGGYGDRYGYSVDISDDGSVMVIGALEEDTYAPGANNTQQNNAGTYGVGAAYVYRKTAGVWAFDAILKPTQNLSSKTKFGHSVAVSGDGGTIVVGAPDQYLGGTGIDPSDMNVFSGSGAAYVYRYSGGNWGADAYVKASNARPGDHFGYAVDISDDGTTLVVTAQGEDSAATGINGNETSDCGAGDTNCATDSGAAYVFFFDGANWSQQAYIKSMNTIAGTSSYPYDFFFGVDAALSADGNTLAIGSTMESAQAGTAYVYTRSGNIWSHEGTLLASNGGAYDLFGFNLALSDTGDTLLIGAPEEDGNALGISASPVADNNSNISSGAVYLFSRTGTAWTEDYYIKASNDSGNFGWSVDINDAGDLFAVGAVKERSAATGINGDQNDTSIANAGAVYVFNFGGSWSQKSYVKSKFIPLGTYDKLGYSLSLAGNSASLLVGTPTESGCNEGFNVEQLGTCGSQGAAFIY